MQEVLQQPTYRGEITNTCTCNVVDDNGDEILDEYGNPVSQDWCDGFCWESMIEDFSNCTEELRNANETSWWHVEGIQLWNRTTGGYFYADNVNEIIRGMSVNSEWMLRWSVYEDRIEYSLSHHDAPTGSASVLRPVSEEEEERLGLCNG